MRRSVGPHERSSSAGRSHRPAQSRGQPWRRSSSSEPQQSRPCASSSTGWRGMGRSGGRRGRRCPTGPTSFLGSASPRACRGGRVGVHGGRVSSVCDAVDGVSCGPEFGSEHTHASPMLVKLYRAPSFWEAPRRTAHVFARAVSAASVESASGGESGWKPAPKTSSFTPRSVI